MESEAYSQTRFTIDAIPIWNDLPKEIVLTTNIVDFKNKLDEAWKNIPMKSLE